MTMFRTFTSATVAVVLASVLAACGSTATTAPTSTPSTPAVPSSPAPAPVAPDGTAEVGVPVNADGIATLPSGEVVSCPSGSSVVIVFEDGRHLCDTPIEGLD